MPRGSGRAAFSHKDNVKVILTELVSGFSDNLHQKREKQGLNGRKSFVFRFPR